MLKNQDVKVFRSFVQFVVKIIQKMTMEEPKVDVSSRHHTENANRSFTLPGRNLEVLYTLMLKSLVFIRCEWIDYC